MDVFMLILFATNIAPVLLNKQYGNCVEHAMGNCLYKTLDLKALKSAIINHRKSFDIFCSIAMELRLCIPNEIYECLGMEALPVRLNPNGDLNEACASNSTLRFTKEFKDCLPKYLQCLFHRGDGSQNHSDAIMKLCAITPAIDCLNNLEAKCRPLPLTGPKSVFMERLRQTCFQNA